MLPLKGLDYMRILTLIALALMTVAPLMAQTPPPQQSVATPPADVKAPPADAAKTASGLVSKVVKAGTGKTHPGKSDLVTVHYTGWKTDGAMFDSSVLRGKPATFPLDRVIAGWTEGVQLMVEGEKRRFWIPEALAYKGQREPKGMLVFDVELISFMPSPTEPPPDVKAVPSDAKRTASGLAYRVVRPGTGARHPSSSSMVTVHYSGWTTDGKLFDSSVTRGQPASFPLDGVIKGWTEGLQLMVEGEKTRFWIPEALAYQGRSAPYGMLVFDVELIKIN
jgi:peptidylprolyl isomerase